MTTLQAKIGTSTALFSLSGDNLVDMFPVFMFDPQGANTPDYGTITIRGITIPTDLWAVNEYITVKCELNHTYKSGTNIQPHIRLFPVNDNAGTVNFECAFFIQHADGTTMAGTTTTLSGTITAGDKTANIGQYLSAWIDGSTLVDGDMLIGTLKRVAGTYGSDVALTEIGIHAPVGRTGRDFEQ